MRGISILAAALALASVAALARDGVRAGALDGPAAPAPDGGEALDGLERDLRARHPKTRRAAVRALAALATPDAWRLVARALDDPESEVGDEAQLCIARTVDPKVVGELLGPLGLDAKSERVRQRAAEALGRMLGPLDARELSQSFGARDGEVTRLAVWSAERLAVRDALSGDRLALASKLESLARGAGEAGTRAAALAALAALDRPRALRLVPSAAAARDAEVRCAALAVAAREGGETARERLDAALADPSPSVRRQAIFSLEGAADRAAIGALVELLGGEQRLRIAEAAVAALQRLSGLKHRRDARPWRDWWAALPEDWRPPARETPGEPVRDERERTTTAASFAGLAILSDRVGFLVDFSGSMWRARDDGRSVKSVVDARLAEGLDALGEGARFNVMPFANEPLAWERTLVDARPANRRRALEFFVACRAQGRGNLYAAVVAALADPEVDTLMVWSDGVPTGGLHSNLELVVPLLLEKNRFRHVALDLILVDAPRGARQRLGELARASGGRALAVSLDDLAGATAKGE